jgi:hypothetical protein
VLLVNGIAERIMRDELFRRLPIVVVGTAQQNAYAQIDVNEAVGD